MDLDNRLKKELSEATVKALLEDAGYRVIQFGIESQVRELACMGRDEYTALDLSQVARRSPDFLVLDKAQSKAELVEVKFRRSWDESLIDSVWKQAEIYGGLLLILFLDQCASRKAYDKKGNEIKEKERITLEDRLRSPAGYVRCLRFQPEEHPEFPSPADFSVADNKLGEVPFLGWEAHFANLSEGLWWRMRPLHKELSGLSEGSISQSILRMRGLFTSLNEPDKPFS